MRSRFLTQTPRPPHPTVTHPLSSSDTYPVQHEPLCPCLLVRAGRGQRRTQKNWTKGHITRPRRRHSCKCGKRNRAQHVMVISPAFSRDGDGTVILARRHRPLVPITQQQHGSSSACCTAVLSPNGKFLDLPFLLSYRTTWVWGWQQSRALPTTPNDDRTWLDTLAPWLAW